MKLRSPLVLLAGSAWLACTSGTKNERPTGRCTGDNTDTAPDTDDTAADDTGLDPNDLDEDGYTPAEGDCDDGDPSISPGEEEVTGNDTDENCDGTLYLTTRVADLAQALNGTADFMTFGEIVTVAPSKHPWPGAVLISETGYRAGEYGTPGEVHIFSAGAATAGGPAGTILFHPEDGLANFGRATEAIHLADGSSALVVGFDDPAHFGGYCAWTATVSGRVGTGNADACLPPFDNDVLDRAADGFTADFDVDGDGYEDLLAAGFANEQGSRIGALWVTTGPLDMASFASQPSVLLKMPVSIPRVSGPGDMTGDGYTDLVLSDANSDAGVSYAGQVFILPGGGVVPDSIQLLDGVDGDREDSNTGVETAAPDLDGDGQLDLCVSAPLDDQVGPRAGRVGCFYGPVEGRHPLSSTDFTFVAEDSHAFFGVSLATLDLEGDGDDELAIGVPDDPYFGHGWPGKVYLFDPVTRGAEPVGILAGLPFDGLGIDMAAGDVDGDGRDDLALGAPWADGGGTMRGSAYLLLGGSGAW